MNQPLSMNNQATDEQAVVKSATSRSRWTLFLVIAVCAAPVILSYLSYYWIKPEGRTNYGTLLDPRLFPMPAMMLSRVENNAPAQIQDTNGKWRMLMVTDAPCTQQCEATLYQIRQLRLMQGKEQSRIERIWLITDQYQPPVAQLQAVTGMHVLRADATPLNKWLPVEQGKAPAMYWYLLDPLGNLVMRYPVGSDTVKIKKDISKLLKASGIG